MRILAIHPFLKGHNINPESGGKSKAAFQLTRHLVENGHEVFILPWLEKLVETVPYQVGSGHGAAHCLPTALPLSVKGVRRVLSHFIRPSGHRRCGKTPRRPLHPVKTMMLKRALEIARPDIVHAHYTHSDFPLYYRALRAPAPLILTHTHGISPFAESYDHVVFPSRFQRKLVVSREPSIVEKSSIIHYPVASAYRRNVERTGSRRLLFIGALGDTRKGLDILIDAYREHPALNEWHLAVIGEGKERRRQEDRAKRFGLNVSFLGRLTEDENVDWLNRSDLLVVPSRDESFGIVYAEALCAGKPVIGFRDSVQELADMLGTTIGVPFDAAGQTPKDLAEMLTAFLAAHEKQADVRERDLAGKARALFSGQRFFDAHTALYAQLVSTRG